MLQRQTVVRAGEAVFDDGGRQLREPRNLAGLTQIHTFGSCNFGDGSHLAFIEQALPVVRQPQRPD